MKVYKVEYEPGQTRFLLKSKPHKKRELVTFVKDVSKVEGSVWDMVIEKGSGEKDFCHFSDIDEVTHDDSSFM